MPALEAFLQQLVRTPSVSLPDLPGANEEAAARLVYDLLLGWAPLWEEEEAPGRPNIEGRALLVRESAQ